MCAEHAIAFGAGVSPVRADGLREGIRFFRQTFAAIAEYVRLWLDAERPCSSCGGGSRHDLGGRQ